MFSHRVINLRIVYEDYGRIRSHDSICKEDCASSESMEHSRAGEGSHQGCIRCPSHEG